MVARLPVVRSAQILYGKLEVVRYRTCCVAARFLKGELVRAVWVELERPDRPKGRTETRRLICTDPLIPAIEVIRAYAKRWAQALGASAGRWSPCSTPSSTSGG